MVSCQTSGRPFENPVQNVTWTISRIVLWSACIAEKKFSSNPLCKTGHSCFRFAPWSAVKQKPQNTNHIRSLGMEKKVLQRLFPLGWTGGTVGRQTFRGFSLKASGKGDDPIKTSGGTLIRPLIIGDDWSDARVGMKYRTAQHLGSDFGTNIRGCEVRVNCCGERHTIVLDAFGLIRAIDHGPQTVGIDKLQSFGGARLRCLEVVELWHNYMRECTSEGEDVPEMRKGLPSKLSKAAHRTCEFHGRRVFWPKHEEDEEDLSRTDRVTDKVRILHARSEKRAEKSLHQNTKVVYGINYWNDEMPVICYKQHFRDVVSIGLGKVRKTHSNEKCVIFTAWESIGLGTRGLCDVVGKIKLDRFPNPRVVTMWCGEDQTLITGLAVARDGYGVNDSMHWGVFDFKDLKNQAGLTLPFSALHQSYINIKALEHKLGIRR